MNRKKKLLLNTICGFFKQIIAIICGFILPRYMLLYYGSSVNGLVSSITHFLSFISLLEMGIGPVIQASLYKPLADKDDEKISKIIISSEKFFHRIAIIFIGYIALLIFIFPAYINSDFDFIYTSSLLVIIAISTFVEYFFCTTYQLLLNSDQKSYIGIIMSILTLILNTSISVVLMINGFSIHLVKMLAAIVFILRPIVMNFYVNRHYNLNKKIVLKEEPIKQKWNGFSQHLAYVVCINIDVVVLTVFSTLSNVSVYHIYYLVVSGITNTMTNATSSLMALFGDMLAKKEYEKLSLIFESSELMIHNVVTILFSITAITIVPFVEIYTKGISDANYCVPVFAVLLVLAYAMQCLRIPYYLLIKAAGHFKETQNGAYVSTLLNVVFSIAVVIKYGLPGVALGTLIAMIYHTCYFVWYLRKNIVNRSVWYFLKYLSFDILLGYVVYLCSQNFIYPDLNYISWFFYALKVACAAILVVGCINFWLFKKNIKLCYGLLVHNKK